MSLDRHEGPWPLTGTLDCDWCGKEVARTEPWAAWWNPFGWCGWTFICGACDTVSRAAARKGA